MGLWNTIKGWLNIGGVKVKIHDMSQVVPRNGSRITGKVTLTTKSDKSVQKVVNKFLLKRTSGRGEEKKSEEFVIAQAVLNQPLDLKAGESKTMDFAIDYSLQKSLKDMGGVLGAVGKFGAFVTKEKDEYLVVAEAPVKGAALTPRDQVKVTLGD